MALPQALNKRQTTGASAQAHTSTHSQPDTTHIQLWDLPVRIFHWSLLAAVSTAIVTGKLGGAWMPVHGQAGLAIVGLVVFRLAWGVLGSTHARFITFAPTPGRILAYVKGRWRGVGHNPLGALSVFALLGVLGVQSTTGLFSNDDIAFTGPLAALVEEALSLRLTSWHHQLANVLFVLLGLHIAAILFYVHVKKDKLIQPMVTGAKEVPAGTPEPRRAGWLALTVSLLFAVAAVYGASAAWYHPTPVAAPAASTQTSNAPSW